MSRDAWSAVEADKAMRWQPASRVGRGRVNRRRPWHQRVLRMQLRSPLIITTALNLVGGLAALLAGLQVLTVVLAIASIGCIALRFRRRANLVHTGSLSGRTRTLCTRRREYDS